MHTTLVYAFTFVCVLLCVCVCVLLSYTAFVCRGNNEELVLYVKQTGSVSLKGTPSLTIIIYKIEYPEYGTSQFSLI